MSKERIISTAQAIREATAQAMQADPRVVVIGEGVPDPKGIFGTTLGLLDEFGSNRVFDMPVAENGMTGVVIGASLTGMRPVLTHQRVDFSLYSFDQIINNAAKWRFMFADQACVPIVIRMVIGRGWGQGAQHSQSLQALFAHIPGLKVVMPATPYDAKGLLLEAIRDDDPVIFLEHRWTHGFTGYVPENSYTIPFGEADVKREGSDITIVSSSYMTIECMRAEEMLRAHGIFAEVVDLRTLIPLDEETILKSVKKTGRLLVVDSGWKTGGFGAEIVARVTEKAWDSLLVHPERIALPDENSPSAPALTEMYYPTYASIVSVVVRMVGGEHDDVLKDLARNTSDLPHDVPDPSFTGPF